MKITTSPDRLSACLDRSDAELRTWEAAAPASLATRPTPAMLRVTVLVASAVAWALRATELDSCSAAAATACTPVLAV